MSAAILWALLVVVLLSCPPVVEVLYIAIMHVEKVREAGKLHPDFEPYRKMLLAGGITADFVCNITWGTVIFDDLPQELLVTQRLERYKYGRAYRIRRAAGWRWTAPSTWRLQIDEISVPPATGRRLERTEWYAAVLLDAFDLTGQHLKP